MGTRTHTQGYRRAELADACGGCAWWSVLTSPHELRTKQTRPGVSTSTCRPCTHSNVHLRDLPTLVGYVSSPRSPDLAPAESTHSLSSPSSLSPLVPRHEASSTHTHIGRPTRLIASLCGNLQSRAQLVGLSGQSRLVLSALGTFAKQGASTLDPTRILLTHPPRPRAPTLISSPNIQVAHPALPTSSSRAFQPRGALPRTPSAAQPSRNRLPPDKADGLVQSIVAAASMGL